MLPLLTMVGFGLGVGAYVTQGVAGVPYLDWLVAGLLVWGGMRAGVGASRWGGRGGFGGGRISFGQAAAPLGVADIAAGPLAYVLFRVLPPGGAFLLITTAFG